MNKIVKTENYTFSDFKNVTYIFLHPRGATNPRSRATVVSSGFVTTVRSGRRRSMSSNRYERAPSPSTGKRNFIRGLGPAIYWRNNFACPWKKLVTSLPKRPEFQIRIADTESPFGRWNWSRLRALDWRDFFGGVQIHRHNFFCAASWNHKATPGTLFFVYFSKRKSSRKSTTSAEKTGGRLPPQTRFFPKYTFFRVGLRKISSNTHF